MNDFTPYSGRYQWRIDYRRLRQIPILSVASILKMQLVRTGGGTWQMRNPENPRDITSLTVFERTNSFFRFSSKEQGGVHGGSPIDIVMHVRNCSLREAVDFLISHFPS